MSTLSDAIKKHQPDPRTTLNDWYQQLDVEDQELVLRIAADPSWATTRVHRMLIELGVGVGKDSVLTWRRVHGFPG